MRRLLLVAYHFPPEPTAGALRPGYLATYLREYGWDVTVLTRPRASNASESHPYTLVTAPVLGEPFESSLRSALSTNGNGNASGSKPSPLRAILRAVRSAVSFPDRAVGWLVPAVAKAVAAHRKQAFDAVLSTAMPPTVHLAGGAIARLCGIPWIADYRDPWTGNHMRIDGGFRAKLESRIERFWLRRAATITAVPTIVSRVAATHDRAVVPIANAYDPLDWRGLESVVPTEFAFCHTGNLYEGQLTPELFFEALAELEKERHPAGAARVVFYGPDTDRVGTLARRFALESRVEQRGVVARRDALAAQRNASNLLIFLKMDEATSHVLGSKVLEYCGSRRPIVAFGPRTSAMREFIGANALGWFASDLDETKQALREAYARFESGDRELRPAPASVLTARDLAAAFAGELERLTR
jgi:hypothetical protein